MDGGVLPSEDFQLHFCSPYSPWLPVMSCPNMGLMVWLDYVQHPIQSWCRVELRSKTKQAIPCALVSSCVFSFHGYHRWKAHQKQQKCKNAKMQLKVRHRLKRLAATNADRWQVEGVVAPPSEAEAQCCMKMTELNPLWESGQRTNQFSQQTSLVKRTCGIINQVPQTDLEVLFLASRLQRFALFKMFIYSVYCQK